MESLSKALVIALQYLGNERNDEDFTEDDDLKIVEATAALIHEASDEEKSAVKKAAVELGYISWAEQIGI